MMCAQYIKGRSIIRKWSSTYKSNFSNPFWTIECNNVLQKINSCWFSFRQQSQDTESELMLTSLSCPGAILSINDILALCLSSFRLSNFIAWNPFPQCFFRTSYKLQHFRHRLFQFVSKHCIVVYNIFILYVSTTVLMLREDVLEARGNHAVSCD